MPICYPILFHQSALAARAPHTGSVSHFICIRCRMSLVSRRAHRKHFLNSLLKGFMGFLLATTNLVVNADRQVAVSSKSRRSGILTLTNPSKSLCDIGQGADIGISLNIFARSLENTHRQSHHKFHTLTDQSEAFIININQSEDSISHTYSHEMDTTASQCTLCKNTQTLGAANLENNLNINSILVSLYLFNHHPWLLSGWKIHCFLLGAHSSCWGEISLSALSSVSGISDRF